MVYQTAHGQRERCQMDFVLLLHTFFGQLVIWSNIYTFFDGNTTKKKKKSEEWFKNATIHDETNVRESLMTHQFKCNVEKQKLHFRSSSSVCYAVSILSF